MEVGEWEGKEVMYALISVPSLFSKSSSSLTVPSTALEKQKLLAAIGFFPIKLLISYFLVNLVGHVKMH